jgi:integrase/recombinase XerD
MGQNNTLLVPGSAVRCAPAARALVNPIQMWADATTDANSRRRRDLLRDKTRVVSSLFTWCRKQPGQVTEIDVKAWQAELETQGLAPATVYAMISRVSSFYRWAMQDAGLKEQIHRNPARLARPKAPRPYSGEKAKALDDDEVVALLEVVKAKADAGDLNGLRDYAMLLLFLGTGKRRSEIVNLRRRDVNMRSAPNGHLVLAFKLKGGEQERVELIEDEPRPALSAFLSYLAATGRELAGMEPNTPIWLRHDRAVRSAPDGQQALSSHGFAKALKGYAQEAGIDGVHVHQLRHTAARALEEETGSIGAVQEMLAHKNQTTTRIYLGQIRVKQNRHSSDILGRWGIGT